MDIFGNVNFKVTKEGCGIIMEFDKKVPKSIMEKMETEEILISNIETKGKKIYLTVNDID